MFDKRIGMYWYCHDYHTGMYSREYRIMCKIKYKPSPFIQGIHHESDESIEYYNHLVEKYQHGV